MRTENITPLFVKLRTQLNHTYSDTRSIIFLEFLHQAIDDVTFLPELNDIAILAKNFGFLSRAARAEDRKWTDNNSGLLSRLRLKRHEMLKRMSERLAVKNMDTYALVLKGIDTRDTQNWTALLEAASQGYLSTVQSLVNHGADTNLARYGSLTPEKLAQENSHYDVVVYLRNLKKRKRED